MEFQCFASMSCVFDTLKYWKVSASYSHYASSSGLLISHTIWRHASFIETIHPPSTPCFNTHINVAIKTNWSRLCLDFKRVNGLCYNKQFFALPLFVFISGTHAFLQTVMAAIPRTSGALQAVCWLRIMAQ